MSLEVVFEPRSVAVYGASATRSAALGNTLLANAAQSGLPVVPIHPRAEQINGHAARRDLASAGGAELALVSVPAPAAVDVMTDAVEGGVQAVVVLSSGFGEAGPEGLHLQNEMVKIADGAGVTLIGPNCMGVVSRMRSGVSFNGSYFWDVPERESGLSFISQSGAIGGMFLDQLRRREAGMTRFLSIGNAAQLGVVEVLEWLADDPATSAIGMFVEGVGDGPRFVEAATKAAAAKPVVALKGGRHASGARAAASHTGSIAGAYGPVRAAFLRAGVEVAGSSEDFFDRLFTLDVAPPAAERVAIVTVSGGPSVIAADAVDDEGLELATLADDTVATLREHLPSFAAAANPVDLTPQCPPEVMQEAIAAVYQDPGVDAVVVINCGLDVPAFGAAVKAAFSGRPLPTTSYLLDVPQVQAPLRAAGIPALGSPEQAVRALALAGRRRP